MDIYALYSEHFGVLSGHMDEALSDLGFDQALIYSGSPKMWFMDDQVYPFRVNPYFKYFVPILDVPNCWIIWKIGQKPKLLLYRPRDFWHVAPPIPNDPWIDHFDIVVIESPEDASAHFGGAENRAFIGEAPHTETWLKQAAYTPGGMLARYDVSDSELGTINPPELISALNWHRSYKTRYEQHCIKQANLTAAKGHLLARDMFFSGGSELEIEQAFQIGCQQSYGELAYRSIVAINEHASVLHYDGRNCSKIDREALHSLLIDAGAEFNGYASDISRTYAFRDGIFKDLISEMDRIQLDIIRNIAIGASHFDNYLFTLERLGQLLVDAEIVMMTPDSLIESKIILSFMPHGLSHFMGVQVHDVGWEQRDSSGDPVELDQRYGNIPEVRRRTRLVEKGQMITVEPGIYFIDQLLDPLRDGRYKNEINWKLIDQLKGCGGIRIEDNVLITEAGTDNLTRSAFLEVES